MRFEKLNTIAGWVIGLIATLIYWATVEPTASFWDCGEFIAVSYKLMVPHPPGAPLFLLINRFFSFFALGDVLQVAYWVNMQSVLSSGLTIMFLYWTIVLLGQRWLKKPTEGYSQEQKWLLVFGGIIGAAAYTFSDSFWFSAAEAEVYAMSSLIMAVFFWLILRWERIEDESTANRWILLVAYVAGLSLGVHLLNLVTIPALALIWYFKRYQKVTVKGFVLTMVIALAMILIIMQGIIPGLPSIAGKFEIFAVNTLGLPFNSGVIFFVLLFFGGLVYLIYYSQKHQKVLLNMVALGAAFVLIGYASYGLVLVRSNFDPPINQNDPSTIVSYVSYLKREQYGDRPLFSGPTFASERTSVERTGALYRKGKDKYEIYDYRSKPVYKDNMLLSRVYSKQPGHIQLYKQKLGLAEGERPSFGDNLSFLFNYQIGHMYMRYFMWNFAGRESDEKDAGYLTPFSSDEDLPFELATNKGRNNFYFLPLILGLIGLFFQSSKETKGFWVVLTLFVMTGIGLVIYLNSPPVEPRERDYIYVGSFYAFAIWIGFGVFQLHEWLVGITKNSRLAGIIAFVVSLSVPGIMAAEGWDNHDRSGRYHSVDQARNTLASCPPNALLFTGGDNDTFPLWYVQNVEGFRTDVRVAVLSYFSTDWYLEQMRQKQYESEPLPFTLGPNHYLAGKNDYVPLVEEKKAEGGINVNAYINAINAENNQVYVPLQDGSRTVRLLSKTFVLPVDKQAVLNAGFVPENKKDRIADKMVWQLGNGKTAMFKNELAMLDIIKSNSDWSRPICFNNTSANTISMDLKNWLHLEGMVYRLMPVPVGNTGGEVGDVNVDIMLENVKKWQFRGLNDPDTYNDDEYIKFGVNQRNLYYRLANKLLEDGREGEALEIANTALENIPDTTIHYSYYMPQYVILYHQLGEHEKAEEISKTLISRSEENLEFIANSGRDYRDIRQKSLAILQTLGYYYNNLARITTDPEKRKEYQTKARELQTTLQNKATLLQQKGIM